ncbi:hypothetical protein [Saccharothrix algeriensis]|uniref:Uncharacterized protein n=1 Tax=Saccharothrix algeriensis TaxID=173560 RepID=A0A8T8I0C3_9PSEU|nr:hypothetical protein [Saccharothrix algeriensis]MBM7809812.1 hypothetical protein [Saccharothrix algeriensis]QTR04089.1 hypothetical protein J7S33_03615 [Saccharothrix algeriensis]
MSAPTMNHQATGYDAQQAYCTAKAAELAYRDHEQIEATAREWGFDRVRHHRSTFSARKRLPFAPIPVGDVRPLRTVKARPRARRIRSRHSALCSIGVR